MLQYNDANTVMASYTAQSLDFSELKYILPAKCATITILHDNNIKSDSCNNNNNNHNNIIEDDGSYTCCHRSPGNGNKQS